MVAGLVVLAAATACSASSAQRPPPSSTRLSAPSSASSSAGSGIPLKPFGVAVDGTGRIYVSDFNSGQVGQLQADGHVRVLHTFLAEAPQHCGPSGLAFNQHDVLFAASSCDKNIVELSSNGHVVRSYTTNPVRGYDWCAITANGDVLASDGINGLLLRFPAGGGRAVVLHRFGPNGLDGVAVDRRGDIFVGLIHDDAVVELDPSGKVIQRSRPLGRGVGNNEVDAVTVDSRGYVYITQGANQDDLEVDKLSPSLAPLAVLIKKPAQLRKSPLGLAVDRQDNLYVIDTVHLDEFSRTGQLVRTWTL